MKLSNSDAIMPGKYNGNDTLKKVPQAFSPRSLEASSNEKSNPSIRDKHRKWSAKEYMAQGNWYKSKFKAEGQPDYKQRYS